MARVIDDPDVPRHRRKAGPRRWKIEVKWTRPLWGWGKDWTWSGKYATERGALDGFEYHRRNPRYRAVRLLDPDGEVVSVWIRPEPPEES